jgi:hypothetical protein
MLCKNVFAQIEQRVVFGWMQFLKTVWLDILDNAALIPRIIIIESSTVYTYSKGFPK